LAHADNTEEVQTQKPCTNNYCIRASSLHLFLNVTVILSEGLKQYTVVYIF